METATKQNLKEIIITVIVIVILTASGIHFLRKHANKEGRELMLSMNKVSSIHADKGIKDCYNIDDWQEGRLVILNDEIQEYKEQHEVIFLKLYTYHYTSSTLFLIFSILSALTVFLITQDGWNGTSHSIKVLFLVFMSLTSFFGISASTFDQKVSIGQNGNAYINYDNLQKELMNYCATNADIKGDSITFIKIHSSVINRMTKLHDFYLEFEKQSVDTNKMFSLEKKEEE
ncbi:hypothetical protein IMCC3317_32100 [Kordia antarctica]|uniref:SMODS and SLOG-associating 2TM effector domain-containing protein n=1 Tax=Kordia antarctica TaxID=1218801 RepID=A0A7L4ZMW7_9FLAO|nr:hypothetical protein [Kordia antarctica]QHI37827.1 hypothetical protein IMCC3317_32100 [Kordia antarctica]